MKGKHDQEKGIKVKGPSVIQSDRQIQGKDIHQNAKKP